MDKILIKNTRIINPALNQDFTGNILISKGKIREIGAFVNPEDGETVIIDGTGLVTAPGLVDMHVHLRDPGFTHKEDIITGCESAAAGGVTSLLCMPNTSPAIDNAETIQYIRNKSKNAKARVYIAAAITKSLGGSDLTDIESLREAGAIALSDDGRPVVNTRCLTDAMKKAPGLGMAVLPTARTCTLRITGI